MLDLWKKEYCAQEGYNKMKKYNVDQIKYSKEVI